MLQKGGHFRVTHRLGMTLAMKQNVAPRPLSVPLHWLRTTEARLRCITELIQQSRLARD
jgi:hypothetical protein